MISAARPLRGRLVDVDEQLVNYSKSYATGDAGSIWDILAFACTNFAGEPAIVQGPLRLTYHELGQRVARLTNALVRHFAPFRPLLVAIAYLVPPFARECRPCSGRGGVTELGSFLFGALPILFTFQLTTPPDI